MTDQPVHHNCPECLLPPGAHADDCPNLREEVRDLTATLERLTDAAASRERRINELADFIRVLRVRLEAVVNSHDYNCTPRELAAQLLAEMGEAPDWRPGDKRGWVS